MNLLIKRAYLVVGLSKTRSMEQATVPRCNHPYPSIPRVCPLNFFKWHGFWIDLRRPWRPERLQISKFHSSFKSGPNPPLIPIFVGYCRIKMVFVLFTCTAGTGIDPKRRRTKASRLQNRTRTRGHTMSKLKQSKPARTNQPRRWPGQRGWNVALLQ